MPKRLTRTVIVLIAALAFLPSVMTAQVNATGSIAGYVTDDGKEPLPGATVTVTSPTMLGVRQVMVDPTGYYKVPALPPGKFKIVVELDQFNKTTRDKIELNVGAMMRLDFALNPKTVTEEEIVVTADAPVIEPEKTTISTVITSDILDSLPILGRDFMSSLRILPGVIQAGDFMSISGGRDTEKNYNIDGMDNVDVAQGKALAGGGYSLRTDKSLMNFDQEAIQELSVGTGGYGAETGWGSAGVINVVTKSGSNDYRGSLYLDFRNNKLDVDNPVAYQSYYFGGSFSGPIVKDKLLFFLSVTPRYNKDAYDRRSWWMKDVPESYRMKGSNLGAFLKLTWLLSEKHTLVLSTNPYHSYSMRHLTLYRYPGDYPEENNYYDNMSVNAGLTSIFSEKFLLESKGLFVFNDNRRRNPPGTHAGTVFDMTDGLHFSGTYGDHDWTKVKANWTETANIFIDDWMGRHTITAGAEIRYNKQTDQRVYQESLTISPDYKIREVQEALKWSTSQTYYAAYLSDKWSPVKNLVLQPGVRVSNNSFMSEFLIEPRFNLSYDPFGDGKTVIRAGANIYRDRVGDYIQQMTNYPLTTVYYNFGGFGVGGSADLPDVCHQPGYHLSHDDRVDDRGGQGPFQRHIRHRQLHLPGLQGPDLYPLCQPYGSGDRAPRRSDQRPPGAAEQRRLCQVQGASARFGQALGPGLVPVPGLLHPSGLQREFLPLPRYVPTPGSPQSLVQGRCPARRSLRQDRL